MLHNLKFCVPGAQVRYSSKTFYGGGVVYFCTYFLPDMRDANCQTTCTLLQLIWWTRQLAFPFGILEKPPIFIPISYFGAVLLSTHSNSIIKNAIKLKCFTCFAWTRYSLSVYSTRIHGRALFISVFEVNMIKMEWIRWTYVLFMYHGVNWILNMFARNLDILLFSELL